MGSSPTESQTHWSDTLPVYDNKHDTGFPEEKVQPVAESSTAKPCTYAHPTTTPHLNALLAQPTTQATLRSLIATLTAAVDGHGCAECSIDSTVNILGAYATAMKAAKKSGKWTKDERKELKREAKGVGRRVKALVKEKKAEGRKAFG